MKSLLSILCLLLLTISVAQKKKIVYLDTLGNESDLYEHIAILNTAWYEWDYDESDPKISYIRFKRLSKKAHDSLTHLTYQKNLLLNKIDRPFVLPLVTDLSGKTWTQKELDDKVVVVNFWFVGCGPCEIEMAELNQMVAKYEDNPDVVFLSLCKSKGKKIEKFLERKQFDFHIASAVDQTIPKFGISTFPTNFVVDHGTVRLALEGTGRGAVYLLDEAVKKALYD
ncbi:MAG: hypothetical protein CMI36_16420 [Owenweeksia sp.]|nr:hypothetical protein [Owenweeksia sp.]